jgi:hypothetical protein
MPATQMITFTWHRDQAGYKLLPETSRTPARIIGKGGSQKPYQPLEEFPALLRVFASIQKTPGGVLDFIEKFGRLTHDPKGESVPTVIGWAKLMEKRLLRLTGPQEDIPSNKLEAHLVADQDGIHLEFRPSTLIDALWLQLGQELSGGTRILRCMHCHQTFRAGPGTRRRADATFCCDEHRIRFNSLARSR